MNTPISNRRLKVQFALLAGAAVSGIALAVGESAAPKIARAESAAPATGLDESGHWVHERPHKK